MRAERDVLFFVAVVTLLVCLVESAAACECAASGPPCEAAWHADAVFAGTVRSIDETDVGTRAFRVVRFDVERGFVNAEAGQIEILTAPAMATCGYSFAIGRRYLVYASSNEEGQLATSICSRTRLLEDADEDLRYLKAMPARATGNLTKRRGADGAATPVFFPGTSDLKRAAVIELKPGDRSDVGVMRLPHVRHH